MLPFTNQFVKLVKRLVPGEETIIETGTKFIDKRLLKIPSFALDALKKETIRLMEIVKGNMELVWGMIIKNSKKPIQQVLITENVINNINKEIQAFAPLLVSQSLPQEQSVEVNLYVNVSSQIERIGDIVKGTAELIEEKVQVGANFTDQAKEDLMKMLNIVNGEYEIIMQNFDDFNIECFNRIEGIEKEIDKMEVDLRNAHIERLMQGVCKPDAGIFYLDILSDLERVSDHIYKIAKLLKKFYKL
jgi:phosphate:Na+ symporter